MYYAYHAVRHPRELQADFQQTYHIMDIIGKVDSGEIPAIYAADLAAQLPYGARIQVADNPDLAWGKTDILLSGVLYAIQCWMYAQGGGKGTKPEPVFKPSHPISKQANMARAMTAEELVALITDKRMTRTEKPA